MPINYIYNPSNNYEIEVVEHLSSSSLPNPVDHFLIKILPKNNAVLLANNFKIDGINGSGFSLPLYAYGNKYNSHSHDPIIGNNNPIPTPHGLTTTYQHVLRFNPPLTSGGGPAVYSAIAQQYCFFEPNGGPNISGLGTLNADIAAIFLVEVYVDDNGNEVNNIDPSNIPTLIGGGIAFSNQIMNNLWGFGPSPPPITANTAPIRLEAIIYLANTITFPLTQDVDINLDFDEVLGVPMQYGCTDPVADTYNINATIDDGSCEYYGCTDDTSGDFPDINGNDINGLPCAGNSIDVLDLSDPTFPPLMSINLCDPGFGYSVVNYDPTATLNPNSVCISGVYGCTDDDYVEYDSLANIDDGTCSVLAITPGCTDNSTGTNPVRTMLPGATLYQWLCSDGSFPVGGDETTIVDSTQYPSISSGGTFDAYSHQGGYCADPIGYLSLTYLYDENGITRDLADLSTDNSYCIYCSNFVCDDDNYLEHHVFGDPDSNYTDGLCPDNTLCVTLKVYGCMDNNTDPATGTLNVNGTYGAMNYYAGANVDDGSCYYYPGCTDSSYLEYHTQTDSTGAVYIADYDDGSCSVDAVFGCTDPNDINYDPSNPANIDDGSCAGDPGCIDTTAGDNPDILGHCAQAQSIDPTNFNQNTKGVVIDPNNDTFVGIGNCDACDFETGYVPINVDTTASYDENPTLCRYCGCTDSTASNYNALAVYDNGSCTWTPGAPVNLRPYLKNGNVHLRIIGGADYAEEYMWRSESFTQITSQGASSTYAGTYAGGRGGTCTFIPGNAVFTQGLLANSIYNLYYGSIGNSATFMPNHISENVPYTGEMDLYTVLVSDPQQTQNIDFETNATNIISTANPNSLGFSAVGCTYDATSNRWSGGSLPDGVELEFYGWWSFGGVTPGFIPSTGTGADFGAAFFGQTHGGQGQGSNHSGVFAPGIGVYAQNLGTLNGDPITVHALKTKLHFTNWQPNGYPSNARNHGLDDGSSPETHTGFSSTLNPNNSQIDLYNDSAFGHEDRIRGISVGMKYIPEFSYYYVEGCTDNTAGTANDFPDINGNGVDGTVWVLNTSNGFENNNYNPAANADDGSCCQISGCTDPLASNYDPSACYNDGSCLYQGVAPPCLTNCGFNQVGKFINVNTSVTNPNNINQGYYCINQSGSRNYNNKKYFWWAAVGGQSPYPGFAGEDNINDTIAHLYRGEGVNHALHLSRMTPPPLHWKGFGSVAGDSGNANASTSHQLTTTGNTKYFSRQPCSESSRKGEPESITNIRSNGTISRHTDRTIGSHSSDGGVCFVSVADGTPRVTRMSDGQMFPNSLIFTHANGGTRKYICSPMTLVGPLWRSNFHSGMPYDGIVNTNGEKERAFTSMYHRLKCLTLAQNYVLKLQIAVDAPSNAQSYDYDPNTGIYTFNGGTSYNYKGARYADGNSTNPGGHDYDYNGVFSFNIGAAADGLDGGQTSIPWKQYILNRNPANGVISNPHPGNYNTISGTYITAVDANDQQFQTTGSITDMHTVRGMPDNPPIYNNLKNERPLDHAYEIFNFSYPFTAVSEQNHFIAITMTGGTIMHILNISVEEV